MAGCRPAGCRLLRVSADKPTSSPITPTCSPITSTCSPTLLQVADFKDFWAAAQAAGYEAYVAEPPETDPQVGLREGPCCLVTPNPAAVWAGVSCMGAARSDRAAPAPATCTPAPSHNMPRPPKLQVCFERCTHGRSKEEVYGLSALFEPAPGWCTLLTLGRLLGKAGSGGGGPAGAAAGAASPSSDGIAEVDMDEDGGGSGTPMAANGSGGGSGSAAMRASGGGEEDGEEEASAKAAKPARSRWAAMDDSSDEEGAAAAAARKRKKLGGSGGSSGGLGVDDWRELLATGKQALAGKAPGSTPRGILSRNSGGSDGNGSGRASAGKKRVRWPDEVRAVVALCAALWQRLGW